MSAPLSRSTSYAPGVPIKSQDLNDAQDYLYDGIYSGNKSIIKLKIDGVGNNAGAASAAQLDVGQSALADTAVAVFRDQLGHVRSAFDHLGYPAGRRSEFRENWDFSLLVSTAITFGSIFGGTGYSRWNCTTTNGTRNRIQTNPTGGLGGTYISTNFIAATASDRSVLYGQYPWVQLQTYTSLVMEFEAIIASPTGATVFYGLTDMNNGAGNAPSNSTPWFGLAARRDAANNWQMIHGDGSTLVYTDLGIAIDPTVGTWIRVRLELHSGGSPYGACGRLFFNDVQVGTNMTTNIPTVANLSGVGLTPQFGCAATGASNAVAGVGPIYLTYNRVALSSPVV